MSDNNDVARLLEDTEIVAIRERARKLCGCALCRGYITWNSTPHGGHVIPTDQVGSLSCLALVIFNELVRRTVDATTTGTGNLTARLWEGWCPNCGEQRMENEPDNERAALPDPWGWRLFICEGCEFTCSTRVAIR